MRTTLDIDEDALAIARSKATVEGISLGRAVSALIIECVAPAKDRPELYRNENGILVSRGRPGQVITVEDVSNALAEP